MTAFKINALKQLTEHQVRFTPLGRRREQQANAERLLAEIEPGRGYPYQYVCFRITDFRPEGFPDLLIDSDDLAHDLQLLIEQLAPVEVPTAKAGDEETGADEDPVLTLEEVGKRLNVSTKTVRRWRRFGLVGQRVHHHGRVQLGFRQSVVDRFVATNADRVERGSRFTQLTDCEREQILYQARELLQETGGGTLTDISRRLSERVGRSPETIRYTIKNYDREHPDQALFPKLSGPLDPETKQIIYSSYRRGIDVDTLAKKFQRTRTSMYRVINEVRAQRLLEQPLDYVYHPSFDDPALEAAILAPMPRLEEYEAKRREAKIPRDAPPELASMYEMPLLDKEQEQHLFRQMNFLKHKAAKLREKLRKEGEEAAEVDPSRVRIQTLKEIEDLQLQATAVKDRLINANMRLVANIAKRHAGQAENFFELLSDGNMSLIRAVEKFDFGRGFKFSTYASWAIMKNFARSIPDEKVHKERFVTGHEEVFEVAPDNRSDENEIVASQERASHSVNRLLQYLEPREREIIRLRAGLDDARGLTLEEIGQRFGITKERVRQLNARAMKRLRSIAEEQQIDLG